MSVRRPTLLAALVAVLAVAGACAAASPATRPTSGRLQIATTVAPLTSLVAAVAGPSADVTGVVPEGTNSHTFEPAPSVARVLSRADVVFVNGLKLEDPTLKLARRSRHAGATIVTVGDRVLAPTDYIFDFSFPKREGKPNPHLWTDPLLAAKYAEVVRDTLSRVDPVHAAAYGANFEKLDAALRRLDAAMRSSFATMRPDQRKLLTYHDAYAYFARDYGWSVIGAIQVDNFSDPTPKEVGSLIAQVRAEGVRAIFGSEVFPSPVLAKIGKESGVAYVDVLRDDDLPGRPGDPEHSLVGLLRFDYATMVTALGGDASSLATLDVDQGVPDQATYPQ